MENMVINNIDINFWKGKKVFLTGNTGFKGSWLTLVLEFLGAEVFGYALEPITNPNLFSLCSLNSNTISTIGDIRNLKSLRTSIQKADPDILFHLAAQPLVRFSYEFPVDTFEINVIGTANVLEAARGTNIKSIVNITTDKVYDNKEWIWPYREIDRLGGYDPYSSSKACSELVTNAYRSSFYNNENENKNFANIATARAGNVIGGGDWSKDRLIPDIIDALINNRKVVIRNPSSIRPWQHVLEPLAGYLMLAEKLYYEGSNFGESWNFGPNENDCKSVEWIVEKMMNFWGVDNGYEISKENAPHEANILKLDWSKSKNELGWTPRWDLEQSLKSIVDFNKSILENRDVKKLCVREIKNYFNF